MQPTLQPEKCRSHSGNHTSIVVIEPNCDSVQCMNDSCIIMFNTQTDYGQTNCMGLRIRSQYTGDKTVKY